MASDIKPLKLNFCTRYVYNSDFVDKHLFGKQYVDSLRSVCKYTSDNASYSDVVKRNLNVQKPDHVEFNDRICSRNFSKTIPRVDKIATGNIVKRYGNHTNIDTGLYDNTKKCTDQCFPQGGGNMKPVTKACQVVNKNYVHKNRFAVLSEHIESHVCDSSVEVQTVNRCQTSTRVKGKNGKVFHKGKNASSVDLLNKHPVQRGHKTCFSPGNNSLNPNVTQSVIETSANYSSRGKERGVREASCCNSRLVQTSKDSRDPNAHCDKYALELNTSLKEAKMRIAKESVGNTLCMQQNIQAFGFIPIYGLGSRITYKGKNAACSDRLQLHKVLRADGRHNYEGLQIPVTSKLNYDAWSKYLSQYWDWQLPLLIKYGFPLDFDRNSPIVSEKNNHRSAIDYPDHVSVYLKEEIENKAMLGPFVSPPIENLHISPFMTREKSNSDNRRVIIDLSWPIGESVNAGEDPDKYLGVDFILSYPSVDNIVSEASKLGKGCQIFKVDISRAFRHVINRQTKGQNYTNLVT